MEIILGYVDEDGDMFFVVFLQIANCVQSLGVCELGMMKNWTEAQIEHQGLILIGTLKTLHSQ